MYINKLYILISSATQLYLLSAPTRFLTSLPRSAPLPFIFPNTTTFPHAPARPVRPARCKKSTVLRGSSTMNTCFIEGEKSSPRERRDVVMRTCGVFEGSAGSAW